MPQNPLEKTPPPLSTEVRPQGNSSNSTSTNSVASRSPVYNRGFPNGRNRSQSALNLGSILNPVTSSSVSPPPPPPPPMHSSSSDDRCYQQRHPQPPSAQGMPAANHAHAQQEQQRHRRLSFSNGVQGSQTRSPHGYTNGTASETLAPIIPPQDATMAAAAVVTKTTNKRGSNSSNSGDNNTSKQLPHRKRTKDKSSAPSVASVAETATLKWQPVETPQNHYGEQPHYAYGPVSAVPPTNGYQHNATRPPPPPPPLSSSSTLSSAAAGVAGAPPLPTTTTTTTTPADVRSIPTTPMHALPIEFINSTPSHHSHNSNGNHHPHHHHHQQQQQQQAAAAAAPPPQPYDTLTRPNSAPMYTVPSPTGNHYYYYHYPTPESPNNSSSTTPPFFNSSSSSNNYNNELPPAASTADTRKRSLPVDHSDEPKRVRQNSDVVAPFPMIPNITSSSSTTTSTTAQYLHHPPQNFDQPPPMPPYLEAYMYHQHQQYQHQHSPYLPPQSHHPAFYPHASNQLPPRPPSRDPNATSPHYIQQQSMKSARPPPPPQPTPTPPIKEKKSKKTKTASTMEPGKPAKKGRPLKNPPSAAASEPTSTTTTTAQQQHDAGSSLKLKELSATPDANNNNNNITTTTTTTTTIEAATTTDEAAQVKKLPKKRGRPPKSEAQKAAEKAANAAKKKANKKTTSSSGGGSGSISKPSAAAKKEEAKRYCTCQSLFESPRYMLVCDHCGKWFHGACVGITAREGEFFDLYYCKECTAATRKQSTRRSVCANPHCKHPARGSTRGSSRSKYCSDNCGMRVARDRLQQAQQTYDSDHHNRGILGQDDDNTMTAEQQQSMMEKKLLEMLQARQQPGNKSQLNIDSNRWDMGRLARMKNQRIKARAIVKFVDIQAQFLHQVLESQQDNDPKMCGYDSRLAWQSNVWHAIKSISREGTDIKVELQDCNSSNDTKEEEQGLDGVDLHDYTICNKIGKCPKHEHWRELRQLELDGERRKQIDILISLDKKRKQIKSRIADRLKQPEGWTFLDNGTICHD